MSNCTPPRFTVFMELLSFGHRSSGIALSSLPGETATVAQWERKIKGRDPPEAKMIVLNDVLSAAEVTRMVESLARVPFRDGRATAGPAARGVKDNEQAVGSDPEVAALARSVKLALERHPTFNDLVWPLRWSNLMFSRYVSGQRYGVHTDDACMADDSGWPLRTDISFTIFLSDPSSYQGGELKFLDATSARSFKPGAGSMVIYPTGVLHEVTPVTSGVRLACVGWVQSLIRRADQREVLFDLSCVRRELTEGDAKLRLDKAVGNLLRMWGES
jgi:PKHD-type hydroxylase